MVAILVVLQNAYREGADGSTAEQRWLKSIWRDGGTGWKSHTGLRQLSKEREREVQSNILERLGGGSSSG